MVLSAPPLDASPLRLARDARVEAAQMRDVRRTLQVLKGLDAARSELIALIGGAS